MGLKETSSNSKSGQSGIEKASCWPGPSNKFRRPRGSSLQPSSAANPHPLFTPNPTPQPGPWIDCLLAAPDVTSHRTALSSEFQPFAPPETAHPGVLSPGHPSAVPQTDEKPNTRARKQVIEQAARDKEKEAAEMLVKALQELPPHIRERVQVQLPEKFRGDKPKDPSGSPTKRKPKNSVSHRRPKPEITKANAMAMAAIALHEMSKVSKDFSHEDTDIQSANITNVADVASNVATWEANEMQLDYLAFPGQDPYNDPGSTYWRLNYTS